MVAVENLKLSEEVFEVTLDDYEILSFHEEKVLRFYHLFTLKNGTLFTVVTEFVGPAEFSENYDRQVELERLFVSGHTASLNLDDTDTCRELITENIKSHGGFLSLIHEFIGFDIDPELFGQHVSVKPVQSDQDDCYGSVVYLTISGVSHSLCFGFLTDSLESTLERVKTESCLPLGIENPNETTDVPMAYISDYLDDAKQVQLTELIRQPLMEVLSQALATEIGA